MRTPSTWFDSVSTCGWSYSKGAICALGEVRRMLRDRVEEIQPNQRLSGLYLASTSRP